MFSISIAIIIDNLVHNHVRELVGAAPHASAANKKNIKNKARAGVSGPTRISCEQTKYHNRRPFVCLLNLDRCEVTATRYNFRRGPHLAVAGAVLAPPRPEFFDPLPRCLPCDRATCCRIVRQGLSVCMGIASCFIGIVPARPPPGSARLRINSGSCTNRLEESTDEAPKAGRLHRAAERPACQECKAQLAE